MALSTKLSAAQAYSRRDLDGDEACFLKGRAGTRVGANYRAACRARSHADFVNKMGHVVEEADESVYWLELIRESGICQHSDLPVLRDEAGQLSAIFNQSQLTAKSNSPRTPHARKSHSKFVNS